jgi:hypothetical protein
LSTIEKAKKLKFLRPIYMNSIEVDISRENTIVSFVQNVKRRFFGVAAEVSNQMSSITKRRPIFLPSAISE